MLNKTFTGNDVSLILVVKYYNYYYHHSHYYIDIYHEMSLIYLPEIHDVQVEERSRYSEAGSSLDGPEIFGIY